MNLPTFFELKKKEIINPLFRLLKSESLEAWLAQTPSDIYVNALTICWDKNLQIEHLKFRFLKLSLQIIATFVTFITRNLNLQLKSGGIGIDTLVILVKEVSNLKDKLKDIEMPEDVLAEKENSLQQLLEPCNRGLAENLTTKCLSNLESIRSIIASYRMTNRPPPTQPSSFVSSFLQPLKQNILDTISKQKVVEKILIRYLDIINETKEEIRRSRELLGKYNQNSAVSDQEKMMKQIEVDGKYFLSELEELGFTHENNEVIAQITKEIIRI